MTFGLCYCGFILGKNSFVFSNLNCGGKEIFFFSCVNKLIMKKRKNSGKDLGEGLISNSFN